MHSEEDLKQFGIGDCVWRISELADLGMSSAPRAHLLVSRVLQMTARVSRNHLFDTSKILEDGLDTPETSSTKCREFFGAHFLFIVACI